MSSRSIKKVLAGLASGPILAGLILLAPLGVLTGLNAALDPAMAIDEFAPEEELLIPFLLLAILISAANGRLAWVMSQESAAGRLFRVSTDHFLADASSHLHAHGHRGRQLALDFKTFLEHRDNGSLSFGELTQEDYGWKFSIGRKDFSELWVLVAHVERTENVAPADEFVLTIAFEPPFLPWRRLAYDPDFSLYHEMERQLTNFLRVEELPFTVEFEPWVDPEPGINSGPMF